MNSMLGRFRRSGRPKRLRRSPITNWSSGHSKEGMGSIVYQRKKRMSHWIKLIGVGAPPSALSPLNLQGNLHHGHPSVPALPFPSLPAARQYNHSQANIIKEAFADSLALRIVPLSTLVTQHSSAIVALIKTLKHARLFKMNPSINPNLKVKMLSCRDWSKLP